MGPEDCRGCGLMAPSSRLIPAILSLWPPVRGPMLNLSSIAVVVSDAKTSARWYQDKLGLEVRSREGHWITVSSKGSSVVLHLCEGNALESGNSGICFMSKDVAKDQKALEAKGVRFTQPTTKEAWGTSASFADPDGNEYWIYEE